MGDLRTGRSYELVEDRRGEVALLGVSEASAIEMRANDSLRSSQLVQRRRRNVREPASSFGVPQPFHDELEKRRLDPAVGVVIFIGHGTTTDVAERHPAGRHLVEHGLDELGLDRDLRSAESASSLYRSTGPTIAWRAAVRSR